jgi:MoaA/NifB/PqqE/SkfB family radical SAM enzyme
MKLPHEKFCVLPWVSLEASPIGTVRPCCLAEEELVDNSGEKFNLAQANFLEVQNSNSMHELRQQFLNKEQPQTCRRCFHEERAGRTSKRMHTLDRLKHMLPNEDWTADAKPLMFLDLKLGNICNLKCRICGSWSSSTFATEELANLPPEEHKKSSYHYQMLKKGAWPRENQQFWSEIAGISNQIQYIEFTGGEPFMIQEHFDMLQGLIDRGLAGNIEIHYNTNGTQWPEHAEEIWRHFKVVEIAFSIDDVGARFEYQRSNAVWSEVVANMDKFRKLRSCHSNIRLQICCTINVFNVYYLEEIANWIIQQGMDFIYWNMLHDPYFFSISALPEKARQGLAIQLQNAQVPPKIKEEFNRIIDFMNNGVSLDGFQMRRELNNLDRKRNQSFAEVAPEFAKLIDYVRID